MNANSYGEVLKSGKVLGKARKSYDCSLGWCRSDFFNQNHTGQARVPRGGEGAGVNLGKHRTAMKDPSLEVSSCGARRNSKGAKVASSALLGVRGRQEASIHRRESGRRDGAEHREKKRWEEKGRYRERKNKRKRGQQKYTVTEHSQHARCQGHCLCPLEVSRRAPAPHAPSLACLVSHSSF